MTKKEQEIAEMWKAHREMVKEQAMEDIFRLKRENRKKRFPRERRVAKTSR